MRNIKDELQNIVLRDGSVSEASQLKKTQAFLRGYAETGFIVKKQQQFKDEETAVIVAYAARENLLYEHSINDDDYLSEGAEQRVYRFDDAHVIKTNSGVFYESWLDYFNSLLIHNFFFPTTAYSFLGFKLFGDKIYAVVKQEFIINTEPTNLNAVKGFLQFNGFENTRNNDYINRDLGLIFEDLHEENVLSNNGILFFVDTVFYLTPNFYNV